MQVRVLDTAFYVTDCALRLPFRFGAVTLTHAPLCVARVKIESDAGPATGHAADLLAPKWFEKDPAKSLREDSLALAHSALAAAEQFQSATHGTVFDLWWNTYRERVQKHPFSSPDLLVRGFGVTLVERALMDAACRAAGLGFHAALREDVFGFRPADALPQLAGWELRLDPAPASSIEVRHTVGLADPLRAGDIDPEHRVDDGLPQSLDEDIRRYGLRCFKIKIGGNPDRAPLRDCGC